MIEQVLANIEAYGAAAVIIWMFMEEFLPVPSAVAPMAAGFLLVATNNPFYAFLTILLFIALMGSAASVLSSYFMYGIGLYGGKPAIQRFGRYVGVNWSQVQAFEKHLTSGNQHLFIAVFRAIPVVPLSVISAGSGFFRINWKTYGIWSFVGMVPRNLVLGMVGWYLAEDFQSAALFIAKTSTMIFLAGATVLMIYFIFRREEIEKKYQVGKGLIR